MGRRRDFDTVQQQLKHCVLASSQMTSLSPALEPKFKTAFIAWAAMKKITASQIVSVKVSMLKGSRNTQFQ